MKEYIDKEAVIKLLDELETSLFVGEAMRYYGNYFGVDLLSPADVKPVVKAKWLDGCCTNCAWECPDYAYYGGGYEEETFSSDEFKYCPKCGAEMTQKVKR